MTPASDLRHVERADVYKGDDLAGVLIRERAALAFHYHPLYLQSGGEAVGTGLDLGPEPIRTAGTELPPFFANLLPEGVRLLGLKDRTRTSLDDHLTLFLAVGRDAVGDVRVVPEGDDPDRFEDTPETTLDAERLFARAVAGEDPSALAGVQEKVSSRMLSLPRMERDGPAIVKLGPAAFPRLVENEAFFLDLAARCGVPAARARIEEDLAGRRVLVVQRFDRRRAGGRWIGIAQEDGCQLTGRYPGSKYAVPWRDLAEACRDRCGVPLVALQRTLAQIVFSWVIGNGDLHAKNYSLGETSEGWMPTPAYDLVSTLPFRQLDQRAALKMDGRDARFRRAQFVEFFGRHGLPRRSVDRTLDRLLDLLPAGIERLGEIGYDAPTTEAMAREMRSRRDALS